MLMEVAHSRWCKMSAGGVSLMTVAQLFATATANEGLKFLILAAAAIGLLWLGRWSSRLGAASPPDGRYSEDIPALVTNTVTPEEERPDLMPLLRTPLLRGRTKSRLPFRMIRLWKRSA
jgi:hypothetical protein